MVEQDRFEDRLAIALDHYADEVAERGGLAALAESITAQPQRRGLVARLGGGGPLMTPRLGAGPAALGGVWLLLLAVALLVCMVAGVALLGGLLRTHELSLVPSPMPSRSDPSPTTAPVVAPASGWAVVAADRAQPGGWWDVVSNGPSFVAVERGNTGPLQSLRLWNRVWRSADGLLWETIDRFSIDEPETLRIFAADGEFLLAHGCGHGDSRGGFRPPCPDWRSTNGVDWRETSTAWGELDAWDEWRVSTFGTLLTTDPPDLEPLAIPAAVTLEFDERLILIGHDHAIGDRVTALLSQDGVTWTPLDNAPPFARLIDELHVGAWWGPWACGFAVRDSIALAVLPSDDGPLGWTSDDGLRWEEIELDLPRDPLLAPQGRDTADLDATWGACLSALSDGWAIAPDAPNARATDVWVSSDGRAWTRLDVPDAFADFEGRIQIAGDTLFLSGPPGDGSSLVVGRIRP